MSPTKALESQGAACGQRERGCREHGWALKSNAVYLSTQPETSKYLFVFSSVLSVSVDHKSSPQAESNGQSETSSNPPAAIEKKW